MKAFVLILLLWNPSANSSHYTSTAEFSSQETCELAAKAASRTFDGYGTRTYAVCTPK